MAKLHYITNTSVDGYIEDASGDFQWSEPDDEVFVFTTELMRPLGTHLYGRRLYETMAVWETDPAFAAESAQMADFAEAWIAADKVVFSTTLTEPLTARTRIEPTIDPDAVRALKDAAPADLMVGGADVATQLVRAGLVDDYHLLVRPKLLGAGKPALGDVGKLDVELVDERRFASGIVWLHYAFPD